jgi:uncharacterized membrane protein (UPF0127 family)
MTRSFHPEAEVRLEKADLVRESDGSRMAEVEVARGFFEKFWGLLGRDSLDDQKGLMLTNCSSIHTCFMRFPLDLIFIDSDFQVVKLVRHLVPWRMALALRASAVIELPAGTLDALGLERGEKLLLK